MSLVFCPQCRRTVRVASRAADCPECGYRPPARVRRHAARQRRAALWTGLAKALLMLGVVLLPLRFLTPRALPLAAVLLAAGALGLATGHWGLWRLPGAFKRKTNSLPPHQRID